MARLQIGIVRYASVARAIGQALRIDEPPECRIGRGRITLTFRQIGASRWSEEQQMEHALHAAAAARRVLADDPRSVIRRRGSRAIEVVYVDVAIRRGCTIQARWECVVPSGQSRG